LSSPPSPPAEQATGTQDRDHSGEASTDDGSGDRRGATTLRLKVVNEEPWWIYVGILDEYATNKPFSILETNELKPAREVDPGATEEIIVVIEEGNSFVVVLCLACKTNKQPEFCYLSRGCYLDSYPSEVAAMLPTSFVNV
jgi:hypothetical protein